MLRKFFLKSLCVVAVTTLSIIGLSASRNSVTIASAQNGETQTKRMRAELGITSKDGRAAYAKAIDDVQRLMYVARVRAQSVGAVQVTLEGLRKALAHLVLPDLTLRQLGPAITPGPLRNDGGTRPDGGAGEPGCHGTLTFGFSSTSGPGWASPPTETVSGTSRS